MTLAVDITDGHGLSNKVCRELLAKKGKVILYCFSCHNKTNCTLLRWSTFKSDHAVQIAKLIKEDWLIVLQ